LHHAHVLHLIRRAFFRKRETALISRAFAAMMLSS
jgi:hypothetical protein